MILFKCLCGEELEAADDEAGQLLMCPICKARVIAPRRSSAIKVSGEVTVPSPPVQPTMGSLVSDTRNAVTQLAVPRSYTATVSLVLGLLSFVFLLASIPAIILGVLALRHIRRCSGQLGGNGLAIT